MNGTKHPVSLAVAKLIKAQMAMKGMTATRLCELTGITSATMSRKLKGTYAFDLDEIDLICQHLDMDAQQVTAMAIRMAGNTDPADFSITGAGN